MNKSIKLPELGENIASALVVAVRVKTGDSVSENDPLLELETNKATVEMPSPLSGEVTDVLVKEGQEIAVGTDVLVLKTEGASAEKETISKEQAAALTDQEKKTKTLSEPVESADVKPAPLTSGAKLIPASPSARRKAREKGIELQSLAGTGPGGYIRIEDVEESGEKVSSGNKPPPLPDFSVWGPVTVEPMPAIRKRTAAQVSLCWEQIPRVTHFDTADITRLESLRKKYADRAVKEGGKLTMAVMVVKIVSLALKQFREFNASIDMEKQSVVYKDYRNIGIAVSSDRGLTVPVIKEADTKNMIEIAAEIQQIALKAREGKLTIQDLQGGTFTVTNLGSVGGTHFTPIVNYPEIAILGMGRSYTMAGFENGTAVPRTILPLSLSYDHRLIDGADAARFVRWIVDAIEEPLLLSLEG